MRLVGGGGERVAGLSCLDSKSVLKMPARTRLPTPSMKGVHSRQEERTHAFWERPMAFPAVKDFELRKPCENMTGY